MSFFFGTGLASILLVGKEIKKWGCEYSYLMIVGAAVAYSITNCHLLKISVPSLLFFSGALAICAIDLQEFGAFF